MNGVFLRLPRSVAACLLLVLCSTSGAQAPQLTNLPSAVYRVGEVVSGVGDVDGDGRADLLVGDPGASGGAGEVRVFSGATGAQIRVLQGVAGRFGQTLLGASDLDGDGVADIVVGAPLSGAGAVQVYSGATGSLLYTVNAGAGMQTFGRAIAEVGDIDGDSVADLTIGAPGQEISGYGFYGSAAVTVVSGATGTAILILTSTATFVEGFGVAVAGPGDLSGDGVPDIAVGVPGLRFTWTGTPPPPQPNQVRIYSGANGSLVTTWLSSNPNEHFGSALAAAGDVDADGVGDVLVGASNAATSTVTTVGRVDMISGQSGAIIWSHTGGLAGERIGLRVAAAGDTNGDGVGEVLVGRPLLGATTFGQVRLLSGVNGAVLNTFGGALGEANFGSAFAGTGDTDQDGVPDIVVGDSGAQDQGRVYVLSGVGLGVLQTISGSALPDSFGHAVAAAGDLNGDLITDILVGAPEMNGNGVADSGGVLAFSGADGSVLLAIPGTVPLENLGYAVAGGSDLDADGVPDLLVGAPDPMRLGPAVNPGRALAYSGATAAPLLTFTGAQPESRLGFAVAFLGDVNGDGTDDILLGEPGGLPFPVPGQVRVHSGATGALLYTRTGAAPGDLMGFAVARLGDIDGDGIGDFLAGAPQSLFPFTFALPAYPSVPGVGYVDVCSGATGALIRTHIGVGTTANFGRTLAGTPDLDGDGVADYAIGAPFAGLWYGGYVDVYSGATGSLLFTVSKTSASYERFGSAISAGGDVDGDGTADLAIGAPGVFGNWGRVEVYSGATGQLLYGQDAPGTPSSGAMGGEHYGHALAWLGDINNDGAAELAVGAPYPRINFASAGRVELITPFLQPVPLPPPTIFGSGCFVGNHPLPPSIYASEIPQSAGSPGFSVWAATAPLGSQATLLIGFSNTSWLGNPLPLSLAPVGLTGCQLLVSVDAMVTVPVAPMNSFWGNAFVPLPVPANPALIGGVVYFQWFVQDPGTITGAPGAGVSAGLMVTIH